MNPQQTPKDINQYEDPPELKPFRSEQFTPPQPVQAAFPPASSTANPMMGDIDSQFDTPPPTNTPRPLDDVEFGPQPASGDIGQPQQQMLASKSPRSKKTLLLIVIAAVLVVLGASASVYAFWYNKPDRAVTDMFSRVLSAQYGTIDGTFGYKSTEAKLDANLGYTANINRDGESGFVGKLAVKSDGKNYDLNVSAVTSKDRRFFIKTEPLKKLVDALTQGQTSMFDGLISKLDGKWLVITPKDLQNDPEADKQAACAEDALRGFITNKKQQQEVAKIYDKHRFIVITKDYGVTSLNGSLANHYDVKYDEKVAQEFGGAVVNTDLFKKVDSCYKGELRKNFDEDKKSRAADTPDSQTSSTKSVTKTELWIDAMTHAPLRLTMTNTDTTSSTLVANFHLGKNATVSIPKADITVDDLKAEIDKIQGGFTGTNEEPAGSGSIQAKARDTERQTDVASLDAHLEAYYAENGFYPASPKPNLFPGVDTGSFTPPGSTSTALDIVSVIPTTKPMLGSQEAYAYRATDSTGKACSSVQCAGFTLYWWKESTNTIQSKSSLN